MGKGLHWVTLMSFTVTSTQPPDCRPPQRGSPGMTLCLPPAHRSESVHCTDSEGVRHELVLNTRAVRGGDGGWGARCERGGAEAAPRETVLVRSVRYRQKL